MPKVIILALVITWVPRSINTNKAMSKATTFSSGDDKIECKDTTIKGRMKLNWLNIEKPTPDSNDDSPFSTVTGANRRLSRVFMKVIIRHGETRRDAMYTLRFTNDQDMRFC